MSASDSSYSVTVVPAFIRLNVTVRRRRKRRRRSSESSVKRRRRHRKRSRRGRRRREKSQRRSDSDRHSQAEGESEESEAARPIPQGEPPKPVGTANATDQDVAVPKLESPEESRSPSKDVSAVATLLEEAQAAAGAEPQMTAAADKDCGEEPGDDVELEHTKAAPTVSAAEALSPTAAVAAAQDSEETQDPGSAQDLITSVATTARAEVVGESTHLPVKPMFEEFPGTIRIFRFQFMFAAVPFFINIKDIIDIYIALSCEVSCA